MSSMADRYGNFAELEAEARRGEDYDIRVVDRGSKVVILAPHGGTIEPVTAEIAEAVAGDDFSFYAFEALTPGAHGDFHITSHLFDEPQGVDIVGRASVAVAIHGRRDGSAVEGVGDPAWLGGRASGLRDAIGEALRQAGFAAERNMSLPGIHETNICNRTRGGEGAQLELSRSLRRVLAEDLEAMKGFALAVRMGIGSWVSRGE